MEVRYDSAVPHETGLDTIYLDRRGICYGELKRVEEQIMARWGAIRDVMLNQYR